MKTIRCEVEMVEGPAKVQAVVALAPEASEEEVAGSFAAAGVQMFRAILAERAKSGGLIVARGNVPPGRA